MTDFDASIAEQIWDMKYRFKDGDEVNNHINLIQEEIKISKKDIRMLELRNWLNIIN